MRLIGSLFRRSVAALLPPAAAADSVYHSEHLRLTPVAGAPLRSGFVENIKAEGPRVYAHEIFRPERRPREDDLHRHQELLPPGPGVLRAASSI